MTSQISSKCMAQVFLIVKEPNVQLCYFDNVTIDKVIETFSTNIWDSVEEKRYISTNELEAIQLIFDKLEISYCTANNVDIQHNVKIEKHLGKHVLKAAKISNQHFIHHTRLTEIHRNRRNFIRVNRMLDFVRVELPMSAFSFNILNKLTKSYCMDAYGWNFIGDNVQKLWDTCAKYRIGIIQEVSNMDIFLNGKGTEVPNLKPNVAKWAYLKRVFFHQFQIILQLSNFSKSSNQFKNESIHYRKRQAKSIV